MKWLRRPGHLSKLGEGLNCGLCQTVGDRSRIQRAEYVVESVRRARDVELPIDHEVIVVDDGSTDGTRDIVRQLEDSTVSVVYEPRNSGKGAALRAGFEAADGDLIVCHDTDLEYDQRVWGSMMRPLLEGRANHRVRVPIHRRAPQHDVLALAGQSFPQFRHQHLYNTTISDMETCYKMMDATILKGLRLEASRFEIEPEVIAKLLRTGNRIYEVPIQYTGREVDEGKKISWRDGFLALWTLIRLRVTPISRIIK